MVRFSPSVKRLRAVYTGSGKRGNPDTAPHSSPSRETRPSVGESECGREHDGREVNETEDDEGGGRREDEEDGDDGGSCTEDGQVIATTLSCEEVLWASKERDILTEK